METSKLKNKSLITLKANYFSSVIMLVLAPVCYWLLDTGLVIPLCFLGFGVFNLVNTLCYYQHKNLTLTYLITTVMALPSALLVTLLSGGINSPFIFILALLVFAAYLATRSYGIIHLYVITLMVIITWSLHYFDLSFENTIPESSRSLFSLICVLFTVYLLGGIFGKLLIQGQEELYLTKKHLELQSRQKELLLKEIHHRVKNNLQTVSSLLNMQSRNSLNPEVKQLLKNSRNRVVSMAMIHEMLYAYEDLSTVDYATYVRQLANHLVTSYRGSDHQITVDIRIPEVKLTIDTAIPIGLLINEFITNTLKHGIPMNQSGHITIELQKQEDHHYLLRLSDNGVGYCELKASQKVHSLGLRLIDSLVRQLQGQLTTESGKQGVHYLISFRESCHAKSVYTA